MFAPNSSEMSVDVKDNGKIALRIGGTNADLSGEYPTERNSQIDVTLDYEEANELAESLFAATNEVEIKHE